MSEEIRLLTALFAAAIARPEASSGATRSGPKGAGGQTWESFLSLLCEITHADWAQMQFVQGKGAVAQWRVGPPDRDMPDIAVNAQMRTSRVYSQLDLPDAPGAGDPGRPLRAIRWRVEPDAWGGISLHRRAGDFRAIDGHYLSSLLPYLAPAVQGWQRLCRERELGALEQRICSDLGAGWILFAPSGQVSAMSAGLAQRLASTAGIRLSAEGWLMLPAARARDLREALGALGQDGGGARVVTLSSDPPVQMVLSITPGTGGGERVGRVRYGVSAQALPLARVMAAFELNRSEARLAVALCDGHSLAAAARDLGWTIETARSTSKRLFARMGVSGQPGVVRALHRSAIWLAPDAAPEHDEKTNAAR